MSPRRHWRLTWQTTPRRPASSALEEPHEVRSWTEALKVSEQKLREAVKAVGHSAEKVREYLRKK
ncbi:DUF3606 domain-containing protein [Variovorax sp. J31P207]|uniref:DUF3606 domain-containing protein n=1 Tax=Variovorax sp. J31P207 TaxID=3053510 RepID=UPI003365AD25